MMDSLDLEMIHSKLKMVQESLLDRPVLSVNEVLALMSEIAEQAGGQALTLESTEQFKEAAALYATITEIFEIAAQKVPKKDRQRIASLANYWLLRARRARLTPEPTVEPTPGPPQPTGPRREPITDRLSLKLQRGRSFAPATGITDEAMSSVKAKPQQSIDLADIEKSSERIRRPGAIYTSRHRKESEREAAKRWQLSRKESTPDQDLEEPGTSKKGA